MMDGVHKDFVESLLKRNFTMQEISDLLRKKIHMLDDFQCVWLRVFGKTVTFLQRKLLFGTPEDCKKSI